MSPSSRASGAVSGSCRLCLTLADCAPAVARPSTQAACSITARQRAICPGASTWGTCTIIARPSPFRAVGHRCPAPGCRHDVAAEILRVIELVGEVVDVELDGRLVVDLVADHGVELPE